MTAHYPKEKDIKGHRVPIEVLQRLIEVSRRVGYTAKERITWLLDFIQRDFSRASEGDRMNLSEEIHVYGSPLKTGFCAIETSVETLSRPAIARLQKELKDYLVKAMEGHEDLRLPEITISVLGAKNPKTGNFDFARYGSPYHLARLQVLEDLHAIDLDRIRMCQRGQLHHRDTLKIAPCNRLFFAKDLRQHFCSPECAQDVRWKKYWKKHGEIINKKRRKTDRHRKQSKAK